MYQNKMKALNKMRASRVEADEIEIFWVQHQGSVFKSWPGKDPPFSLVSHAK